ncbi:MAG: hypothetical protein J0H65_11870 [Rhizobiales bacterium]|nr:hypothetical protein [Hyphomicrobiales bacterium]
MPTLKDEKPAPEELTAEQKERTDAEYIAAVNKGLAAAVKEADEGKLIPVEDVWAELGVESAGR